MTLSVVTDRHELRTGLRHEALFYADTREFLAGTSAFINDGLAGREPILVVLSAEKIALLRARLGRAAARVRFEDMGQVGLNPARIIPLWRRFADQCLAAGGPFRGIGEPIWSGRSRDELVECQRHEQLLNLAFADAADFRLLCPYDTSALGRDVLDEASRSHAGLVEGTLRRPSAVCLDLTDIAAPFDRPLPEPEPAQVLADEPVRATTLAKLRRTIAKHARALGVRETRTDDLVVAVNEITSNTVRHGGGRGRMRVWSEDGAVVCEVADSGRITDPLAGRVEPHEHEESGRGLWMATQLCDLTQVRTFASGSVVRLWMRADA